MIKKIALLIVSVSFVVSTAHAQSVVSDHDSKLDFKNFKTYAWLAPGDSVFNRYRPEKLFCGTIMHAANMELTARGMKSDTTKPDAIFVFYTTVDEIMTYSQSPMLSVGVGVAGPGYYVAGYAPVAGGEIKVTREEDGMLKYAMFDTKTGQMVWSGMVEKTFKSTDDVEKIIYDYTARIFKKYPVRKK